MSILFSYLISVFNFFVKVREKGKKLNKQILSNFPLFEGKIYGFFDPIKDKKKDENYFVRFYKFNLNFGYNRFIFILNFLRGFLNFEIVNAKKVKAFNKYNLDIKSQSLINLGSFEKKNDLILELSEENKKNIELKVASGKFSRLKLEKGKYSLKSKKNFLISKPFILNTSEKEIVIYLFVDGLPGYDFLEPHISFELREILEKSVFFKNHFSLSEWTLPSFTTIMSGLSPSEHKYVLPRKLYLEDKNFNLISNHFRENNYITTHITSNWRCGPIYNNYSGFDKTIFGRSLTASKIYSEITEHLETFGNNKNFICVNVSDLHHMIYPVNLIKSKYLDNKYLSYISNGGGKISFSKKSINEKASYEIQNNLLSSFKSIELDLLNIINYVKKKYSKEKYLIALMTDHGHSFLDSNQENYILKDSIIRIPLFLISNYIDNLEINSYTDNSDLSSIISSLCNLKLNDEQFSGKIPLELNGTKKNFVVSQSIYPHKKYYSRIISENFDYRFSTNHNTNANGKICINGYKENIDVKNQNLIKIENLRKIVLENISKFNEKVN